jgi:hypothetical protein
MGGDFIELLGNATFTFVAAEQLPPAREDAIRNAVDKREGLPPDDARAALAMVYHQRSQISTLTTEIERLKADNKALAAKADGLEEVANLLGNYVKALQEHACDALSPNDSPKEDQVRHVEECNRLEAAVLAHPLAPKYVRRDE